MAAPLDAGGLQAERTQLAWVRTALATGALAAVAARPTGAGGSVAVAVLVGLGVAAPGVLAALLRIRALQEQAVPHAATPATGALLAGSLALADVVALALLVG
jgi:uncharacterized membrane protein YidH (DUF202 family)